MNSGDSDGKKTTSTEDIFNYINNSGERDHPSSNKPNAHIPPIATSATQAAKPKCIDPFALYHVRRQQNKPSTKGSNEAGNSKGTPRLCTYAQ
jgi:hypothetical protein